MSSYFSSSPQISVIQQKTWYSDEIGISKLDANGMMSKIIWTKSKVAVLMDSGKNCIRVFAPGYSALRTQNYNEITLLKKVETSDRDIKTFHAIDANDNKCILILTENKDGRKEEQLRIYLFDKVYIYNFIPA